MMFIDKYPISVVWVDLDDTIIDFATNARTALKRMYESEGLNRWWTDAGQWADDYERHNHALWAQYNTGDISRDYLRMERFAIPLVEAGVARADAERMSLRFDPLYLDYLAHERNLMPGAMDLLRYIKGIGVKVGVLSNGFKEVQYRKMDSAGVTPFVDITVLSDDIGVNKPDIRIFHHAMQQSGEMRPGRHLMIGDNPATDIAGASNAGWHTIHYLSARAAASGIPKAKGCLVVEDLLEIKTLITP